MSSVCHHLNLPFSISFGVSESFHSRSLLVRVSLPYDSICHLKFIFFTLGAQYPMSTIKYVY